MSGIEYHVIRGSESLVLEVSIFVTAEDLAVRDRIGVTKRICPSFGSFLVTA